VARCRSASSDDVRAIQRRRGLDELSFRLSLEFAERGIVWVADDDSEIIGIAIAHDSEDERYVGDLFVEPSYRGHGVGAQLLDGAFGGDEDRARAAAIDANDAAALNLAFRFRMAPRETVLRFAGAIPKEEELALMAAGEYRFQVDALDPAAHGFGLNELDRQTRGTLRPADHAFFARSAAGFVFYLDGEFVGYAYVWPDGRIGPLACASEAYVVQVFAYALASLQRRLRASWCTALIPGSNRRIARTALRAGLRVEETYLLASDSYFANLRTYVGYHRLLL
jgi:GNAT superfamily N-acetyltransferase